MENFSDVKKLFKNTISGILQQQGTNEILNESAFPAYANKNPLIDYLFWSRVRYTYDFLRKQGGNVLDFGCGSGVLGYALAVNNINVTAFDITLQPIDLLKEKITFPENIEFVQGDINRLAGLGDRRYDVIAALDVLEHISDIESYLAVFEKLLKPGGYIIASGPTENILYKAGRRFAGKEYSGDYHETNIIDIRKRISASNKVIRLKTLYPLLPLFEIFKVEF